MKESMEVAGKAIEWLPKILKRFKPYEPVTKDFNINYKTKRAEIGYLLDISEKRFTGSIKIPRINNLKISKLYDQNHNNLYQCINLDSEEKFYEIKKKNLPNTDTLFAILEGDVNESYLNEIVYVATAANPNTVEKTEKYWLNCAIKNQGMLENLFDSVCVNEINASVNVKIENHFQSNIPKDLQKSVSKFQKMMEEITNPNFDRNKALRAIQKFRSQPDELNYEKTYNYFKDIVNKLQLDIYVDVEKPYYQGFIEKTQYNQIVPSYFKVEAITDLTLRNPEAKGYVTFKKNEFKTTLREEMEKNPFEVD